MRHYEVVFIVHPEQSEKVSSLVDHYRSMIVDQGGYVHHMEDWGQRQMAYPIRNLVKAHYFCMNIQCGHDTLGELQETFRYNGAILRYLLIRTKKARTSLSHMVSSPVEAEVPEKPTSQVVPKQVK